jgi:hypothetical protein
MRMNSNIVGAFPEESKLVKICAFPGNFWGVLYSTEHK